MIYDQSKRMGNVNLTIADSGKILMTKDKRYLLLTLYNGEKYEEIRDQNQENSRWAITHPSQKDRFSEENITIELSGFGMTRTDESLFKEHYHMLNIIQLQKTEDSLQAVFNQKKSDYVNTVAKVAFYMKYEQDSLAKARVNRDTFIHPDTLFNRLNLSEKQKVLENALYIARNQKAIVSSSKDELDAREAWIVKHRIEFHLKFTLAFACLILFFVGAPLGAIIRKGGLGMPVVVSVLFFIVYYIISLMGEKFAKEMMMPAWAGIWLSSAVLFPIGLFLTYKAATDSTIFNIDMYLQPFKKISNKIFRKKERRKTMNNENTTITQ